MKKKESTKIKDTNLLELFADVYRHYPNLVIKPSKKHKNLLDVILQNGGKGRGNIADMIFFCSGLISAKEEEGQL